MVQSYVSGESWDTNVLAADGEILACFQQYRVRTYPEEGGTWALMEGVHEPAMLRHAAEVIDALDWTGPAMVEFMRTPDDEFFLIEVNGRYWGSVPLTINSGVDIARLHYLLLQGEPRRDETGYRIGVRQRRLLHDDLLWVVEQLSAGDLRALWPFLESFATAEDTIPDADDPMPLVGALCHTGNLVGRRVRRALVPDLPLGVPHHVGTAAHTASK